MAESSASLPNNTRRAVWPRVRRGGAWLLAVLLVAAVLSYVFRVRLLNWVLNRVVRDYEITVLTFDPGWRGGNAFGIRVSHRLSGQRLAIAGRATVDNGWHEIVRGRLGSIALNEATVTWREDFNPPERIPRMPGPVAVPIVSWSTAEVTDSRFEWYARGSTAPRFKSRVKGTGGAMTIYDDGTVEAAPQHLDLAEISVSENVHADAGWRLAIRAEIPRANGTLAAQHSIDRYVITGVEAGPPVVSLTLTTGGTPSLHSPARPRESWEPIPASFLVQDSSSAGGHLTYAHHSPPGAEAAATMAPLRLRELLAGGIDPFRMTLDSAQVTNVKFHAPGDEGAPFLTASSMAAPVEVRDDASVRLATASLNGVTVHESSALFALLGVEAGERARIPALTGTFDASGGELLIAGGRVHGSTVQQCTVRDVRAVREGQPEPVLAIETIHIRAVPDEALAGKRLREVHIEKPLVHLTKNLRDPPEPAVVIAAHAEATEPFWHGWHADTLTVTSGTVRGSHLGDGVPDLSAAFSVETCLRAEGGPPVYRASARHLTLTNPLFAGVPLFGATSIDVLANPSTVWQDHQWELFLNGTKVNVESLLKFMRGAPVARDNVIPDTHRDGL